MKEKTKENAKTTAKIINAISTPKFKLISSKRELNSVNMPDNTRIITATFIILDGMQGSFLVPSL